MTKITEVSILNEEEINAVSGGAIWLGVLAVCAAGAAIGAGAAYLVHRYGAGDHSH